MLSSDNLHQISKIQITDSPMKWHLQEREEGRDGEKTSPVYLWLKRYFACFDSYHYYLRLPTRVYTSTGFDPRANLAAR